PSLPRRRALCKQSLQRPRRSPTTSRFHTRSQEMAIYREPVMPLPLAREALFRRGVRTRLPAQFLAPGRPQASERSAVDDPHAAGALSRDTLALVMAGGRGTRLRDLAARRAKPAVPFGGKFRIIDFTLSNCVNSGIRRIGVLLQYEGHSLIRHLQ